MDKKRQYALTVQYEKEGEKRRRKKKKERRKSRDTKYTKEAVELLLSRLPNEGEISSVNVGMCFIQNLV